MTNTTATGTGPLGHVPIEQLIPRPTSIEETELSLSFLADLVLKLIYYKSDLSGVEIAEEVTLPFRGVAQQVLEFLKREEYAEVSGSSSRGYGEGGYQWLITRKGADRALQALDRDQYVGPAPVSLDRYNEMVLRQSVGDFKVGPNEVQRAVSHLVLSADLINKLGPAVNSGRSLFLYGPPGNGKTVLAKSIVRMLTGAVYIPYTIVVDGQIIRLYDELNHRRIEEEPARSGGGLLSTSLPLDDRWVKIRRPEIVVGGELTMRNLDLIFDPVSKTYEAPFQMKANTGLFVIDDFGRQAMRPMDLLNRWIVPLELRIDFLTLQTGKKIEIPFDQLIVFSTNLDPKDLVDEAFLRRIRHKLLIDFPDEKMYYQIMQRECASRNIDLIPEAFVYLMQKHYIGAHRNLRSCHPRDILDQIVDIAGYFGARPALTKQWIDAACDSYFSEL